MAQSKEEIIDPSECIHDFEFRDRLAACKICGKDEDALFGQGWNAAIFRSRVKIEESLMSGLERVLNPKEHL
jgi:hypothetical protein